jgi:hypothetical protein
MWSPEHDHFCLLVVWLNVHLEWASGLLMCRAYSFASTISDGYRSLLSFGPMYVFFECSLGKRHLVCSCVEPTHSHPRSQMVLDMSHLVLEVLDQIINLNIRDGKRPSSKKGETLTCIWRCNELLTMQAACFCAKQLCPICITVHRFSMEASWVSRMTREIIILYYIRLWVSGWLLWQGISLEASWVYVYIDS